MSKPKPHPRKGKGKAQKALTAGRIRMYARKGFTKVEMAAALGISIDAITDNFAANPELKAAWAEGVTQKVERLRDLQWRHAKDSVPMTIHLSKHQLGEHDQALVIHKPDDDSMTMIKQLFKAIDGTGRGLPDPAKVRPAIEYQGDVITVEPPRGAGATATVILPEVEAGESVTIEPDKVTIVEQPTSQRLVMPPRRKSLLPEPDEVRGT